MTWCPQNSPSSGTWLVIVRALGFPQVGGSWFYTMLVAVDLARGLYQSVSLRPDNQRDVCEFQRHLAVYHVLGGGYALSTTVLFTVVLDWAGADNKFHPRQDPGDW